MKELKNKRTKGITLIALVITIIVLLILAGVSIATLTGQNGILTQVDKAKLETRSGKVEEEVNLWKTQINSGEYVVWNTEDENTLLNRLKDDGSVLEEEINRSDKTITIGNKVISYQIELPNGKLGLEYEIKENTILMLYPKIGGHITYKEYATEILKNKSEQEKENLFIAYINSWGEKEFKSIEEILQHFHYNSIEEFMNYRDLDEYLIEAKCIDYEAYSEKYEQYEYYRVKMMEDGQEIGSTSEYQAFPIYIREGTHTYTAIGEEDNQEASITLTFNKNELPRYIVELQARYYFKVYDNQEKKYITFNTAKIELKRGEKEIINKDVTSNIEQNDYEFEYTYSEINTRTELSGEIWTHETLEAKLLIDGKEIQNKVCMPNWFE